jgi:hypothetical protein
LKKDIENGRRRLNYQQSDSERETHRERSRLLQERRREEMSGAIAATEFWPSLSSQLKKNRCSPCFIVIMTFRIDIQKFVNVIFYSNT